jgi:hypothetical protein
MPDYNIPLSSTTGAASGLDTSAPINPTGSQLPLQVKPFNNIDPVKEMAKAYALADDIGQFQANQAQRMNTQVTQETKARDQAILKAYQQSGNGLHSAKDLDLAIGDLGNKLSPDTLENLQKRRDMAKDYEVKMGDSLNKLSDDHLVVADKQYESSLQYMNEIKGVYADTLAKTGNQQQALQAFEASKQAKLQMLGQLKIPGTGQPQYPPEVLQKFAAMTPDQLNNAIDSSKYNREILKDQLHNRLTQAQTESADALAGQRKEATEEMPQKLALLAKKSQGGTPLSDDDKTTLAEMVRKNVPSASTLLGRLPAADKEAVISKITELNKGSGTSASDAAVGMVGEKADALSLNQATKKLDAISSIMSSFHNNVNTWDSIAQGKPPVIGGDKLKELGSQLQKIDFTDSTSLNNWKNSVEKQFNDPSTVAYLTSAFTVAMDYARILSSQGQSAAQVSDSAREEAVKLISSGYNDSARKALIGTLESDAQGQVKGISDQVDAIKKRMAGPSSTGSSGPSMKVSPDDQKKRDTDALPILQDERQKEVAALNAAKTSEDKTRAQQNIDAIDREIKRKGGAPGASKPAASISDEDAVKWAKEHPDDPRSKKILEAVNG